MNRRTLLKGIGAALLAARLTLMPDETVVDTENPRAGVSVYDAKDVVITIGGVEITGFADADFLIVENVPDMEFEAKVHGAITRVNVTEVKS